MLTIEHVAIFADDTVALKDWYCELFDMEVVFTGEGEMPVFFVKDANGVCFEIIPRRQPEQKMEIDSGLFFHLAFQTDDFDKTVQCLKEKGVQLEDEMSSFTGTRIVFFYDIAGNRCQVVWRQEPLTPVKR